MTATAHSLSCKQEYDTLLTEMRDPDVRAFFGADKVSGAKESAKRDWTDAERSVSHIATVCDVTIITSRLVV